jgi:colanic acid biosynthesis glycosyl transferase WcaI
MTKQRILIISQPYPPDPAATGKYMEDVALALAAQGHKVEVFASRERLDKPSETYKSSIEGGVRIRRFRFSSFGKNSLPIRILGAISFALQSMIVGVTRRRIDCVFVSTAPPTGAAVACILAGIYRARMTYWVHDVNPDQAVALELLPSNHLLVKTGRVISRWVLGRADRIIVLDDAMLERIVANGAKPSSTRVLPPWPHDDLLSPIPRSRDTFRSKLNCQESFLVMYSGNLGISHSLDTLFKAAKLLRTHPEIKFAIIGQGAGMELVRAQILEENLTNVTLLPYQPAEKLAESLSAADLHVVVTHDELVGILHPCKAYSALAVERPILSIGPLHSPISSLVNEHSLGWSVATGDSQALQLATLEAAAESDEKRSSRTSTQRHLKHSLLNKPALCGTLCQEIIGTQEGDNCIDSNLNLPPMSNKQGIIGK